jgi:hypothetical protein
MRLEGDYEQWVCTDLETKQDGVVTCRGLRVAYRRVLDWMIGFIDTLYIQLGTSGNYSATGISTIYSSPLHTHYGFQSSLVVSWQRIYNSLTMAIPLQCFH